MKRKDSKWMNGNEWMEMNAQAWKNGNEPYRNEIIEMKKWKWIYRNKWM